MKHYGHLIRVLHWCTDQTMTGALETMDLTAAQGHVMGYLAHCKEPPCPRDLEAGLRLTHPTVSGLLSRLEQKGFIALRADPSDRRCKRIHVLEKGRQCQQTMYDTILRSEQQMVSGFTPEEQAQFTALLQRAIANMGSSPCHHHHSKEDKT